MDNPFLTSAGPAVTDVYTDLHGLQNLKAEKNTDEALKKVSQQFESLFINMLLKNMRAANEVFSEGNMFDSQESKFYRDMQDNQTALSMAHGRGFGVAEAMYRQLSRNKSSKGLERDANIEALNKVQTDILPLDALKRIDLKDLDLKAMSQQDSSKVNTLTAAQKLESGTNTQACNNTENWSASSPKDFVDKVKGAAKVAAKVLGIESEVLIAQAALETGWGKFVLENSEGQSSHNLFNIKADSRWQGEAVDKNVPEYLGGELTQVESKFRSYDSIEASFNDFTQFIRGGERYQDALESVKTKNTPGLEFISGIHQAGYATDPNYLEKVAAVYDKVKSLVSDTRDRGENEL